MLNYHACRYCLGIVLNTFAYEEEKQMRLQCQSMLAIAKNIFSHLGKLQLITLTLFEICSYLLGLIRVHTSLYVYIGKL